MKARYGLAVAALTLMVSATACGRSSTPSASPTSSGGTTASTAASKCASASLQATDTGITADTITVAVLADVNSPLAPGLFKGNWDGVQSWAKFVNANGGLGCRQVKVELLDSQLDPSKATNGNIQACKDAVAMIGNNALFDPTAADVSKCKDAKGQATGIADIAGIANDVNEMCNPTTFVIQVVNEYCPITPGLRKQSAGIGIWQYYKKQIPDFNGMFLVPSDLPTTLQSAVPQFVASEKAGVKWGAKVGVSGLLPQPGYDKFIQQAKSLGINVIHNGSNDATMIKMRKESVAQGFGSQIKLWSCTLACYTNNFLVAGGSAVEGTSIWLPFLPYEEADLNADAKAYLDGVGGPEKATSWGAQAFQAGEALRKVVDQIVAKDGPNAITRASIIDGLKHLGTFDSNGWMGPKDLRGNTPCYVVVKVQGGKFVRVFPQKRGTFECDPSSLIDIMVDPVAGAKEIK